MKKLTLAIALLLMSTLSFAQETQIQKDIRHLLEISGSGELGLQVANQMVGNYKLMLPNVPDKFWDEFMASIQPDDLIELVIPIYEKYYSLGDIKAMISFYNSEVGKKMISVTPMIMQESMVVGQAWGAELGEQVIIKLQKEGYSLE